MKKNLQTSFQTRQYMLSKDFEIYYYNDNTSGKVKKEKEKRETGMEMTLRWYGSKFDTVTLEQIRQIPGVKGVLANSVLVQSNTGMKL